MSIDSEGPDSAVRTWHQTGQGRPHQFSDEQYTMDSRRHSAPLNWRELQEKAHLPAVQELIREGIVRGDIRVRPAPGGGILIIPARSRSGTRHAARAVEASAEGQDDLIPLRHPPVVAASVVSG